MAETCTTNKPRQYPCRGKIKAAILNHALKVPTNNKTAYIAFCVSQLGK